jgi:hypothetical protein
MTWKLLIALTFALTVPAQAQSTFTDSSGRYSGSATTRGNSTSFTDRRGNFAGSAITSRNGKTDYFDRNGRYQGRPQGPRRPSAKAAAGWRGKRVVRCGDRAVGKKRSRP